MATSARTLDPTDVLATVQASQQLLTAAVDRDWTVRAGTLDWDCRATLDHMVNALAFYAGHIASQATERVRRIRNGDPSASIPELFGTLGVMGNVLTSVMRAAPADGRFFHPAGMADLSGFAAMACTEVLVHTSDIARGLQLDWQPSAELSARVLARLFPWVTGVADPWSTLCWATGRISLADRDDVDADWQWHCAPLSEWDGTVKKRAAPPAWR